MKVKLRNASQTAECVDRLVDCGGYNQLPWDKERASAACAADDLCEVKTDTSGAPTCLTKQAIQSCDTLSVANCKATPGCDLVTRSDGQQMCATVVRVGWYNQANLNLPSLETYLVKTLNDKGVPVHFFDLKTQPQSLIDIAVLVSGTGGSGYRVDWPKVIELVDKQVAALKPGTLASLIISQSADTYSGALIPSAADKEHLQETVGSFIHLLHMIDNTWSFDVATEDGLRNTQMLKALENDILKIAGK